MADEVDIATAIQERSLERVLAQVQRGIPPGVPGSCRECDRASPRLVGGRCAPCRDGRRR